MPGLPIPGTAHADGVARPTQPVQRTPLQTGGSVTTSLPVTRTDDTSDAAVSVEFFQSLLRGAGTRINTQSIRIAMYQKDQIDAATKLRAIHILANADIAYWQLYVELLSMF